MIACCAEIGIRTVFTSHLYQFNGKIFLQQDGGPIGVRLSGAVARAVMGEWDATLNSILATNRLLVWLLTRYVDDCTILMNALAMGVNWCNNCKRLAYSKDWEEEDRTTGLSNTARTMQVVERVMNSIFRNIVVTTEIPEKFRDNKLPVLDFKCWVEERTVNHHEKDKEPRQRLLYTFFSKEMSSKYAIMRTSALPENMKVKSLSNDLVRQMKNVSELNGQEERNEVVDTYSIKLCRSGYRREAIKRMIVAGLHGYEKIKQLEMTGKTRIHRSAKSSLSNRYRKKLLGKSTWFQDKKKSQDNKTPNQRAQPPSEKSRSKVKSSKEHAVAATTTVLFVPQTPFGNLANKLRKAELELFKLCGTKVKIVERAGTSLKSLLSRPNPWGNLTCNREKCLTCKTEKNEGLCSKRSLTYETRCLSCAGAGREKLYIGETARSSYERGAEHQHDYKVEKTDSHMHLHAEDAHVGEEKPSFSMKILRCHKSPMYRQIHEAILIAKYEPMTLNAKNEYNCCLLPRLAIMMGEKDAEEDHQTSKDCEDIEENMKRKENPPLVQRVRKRIKLDEKGEKRSSSWTPQRSQGTPKRRLDTVHDDSPRKRSRFLNNDVRSLPEKPTPTSATNPIVNSKKRKPATDVSIKRTARSEPMKSTKFLVDFYEKFSQKKNPKRSSTAKAKSKPSNLTQPKIFQFTVAAHSPTEPNLNPTNTTPSSTQNEATATDVPPKMQLRRQEARPRESEILKSPTPNYHHQK